MKPYTIKYQGTEYQCRQNETLLDAFIRQGVDLTFSCRKGSCHVCMMHCLEGGVPASSQKGIRQEYIDRNYFLPCCCQPSGDMRVDNVPREELIHSGVVHVKEMLSESIFRLVIEPAEVFDYLPGQFLRFLRPDGTARCYSLASLPDDYFLEFHIKRMRNGKFSNWIVDQLNVGDCIDMQGPYGDCVYRAKTGSASPIVLIGKSSGLAPLVGVVRDALAHQHSENIFIYHVGDEWPDVYHGAFLKQLSQNHANVHVLQGITRPFGSDAVNIPDIVQDVAKRNVHMDKVEFYMAGPSRWLGEIRQSLLQHGASSERIYTDPFEFHDLRKSGGRIPEAGRRVSGNKRDIVTPITRSQDQTKASAGIWKALDDGTKLRKILEDFYSRVYSDNRLSPFFHNTTIQRSIEKQFLFLRQRFTGEKIFFGDKPRNAHHWMVISNELFDYRKSILLACMQAHHLAQEYIDEWLAYEETFRADIVKSQPWPKVVNGMELPLNGYESIQLDVGTLCDGCQREIMSGNTVQYHVRLGLAYCETCMGTGTK